MPESTSKLLQQIPRLCAVQGEFLLQSGDYLSFIICHDWIHAESPLRKHPKIFWQRSDAGYRIHMAVTSIITKVTLQAASVAADVDGTCFSNLLTMSKKTSRGKPRGGGGEKRNGKAAAPSTTKSNRSSSWLVSWKAWLVAVILAATVSIMMKRGTAETHGLKQKGTASKNSDNMPPTSRTPLKRTELLPILDQLFPFQTLDLAWEDYPLLSTAYQCDDCTTGTKNTAQQDGIHIPTIYQQESSHVSVREMAQNLMISPDDILAILHPMGRPPLTHGEEFRIVRKIIRDGEEWTGYLPDHMIATWEQRKHALTQAGFSLIINKLQTRWKSVAEFARRLEEELLSDRISANLYLTPPPPDPTEETHQAGFESHWDWMDVIVMQISGTKVWSVANAPKIQFSTYDKKYKPTIGDLDEYMDGGRYQEYTMHAGDVLYIPRGFIHNASSTDSTSLHLTFGIEHGCQTTVEAVIHHAIEVYAKSFGNPVAIPQAQCNGIRDIAWKDLLHFVVAEVGRRDNTCNSSGSLSSCALRRSIPIHKAFLEVAMAKRGGEEATSSELFSNLVLEAFSYVLAEADLDKTFQYLQRLATRDGENIHKFCHPFLSEQSTIPCPAAVKQVDRAALVDYMQRVQNLILQHSETIQQQVHRHLSFMRRAYREEDDEQLRIVGQLPG